MPKRKSLVAAANGPFVGPWIYLEAGEWEITLPASGGFDVKTSPIGDGVPASEILTNPGQDRLLVVGPSRVQVTVLDAVKNVFVQATQVSRA